VLVSEVCFCGFVHLLLMLMMLVFAIVGDAFWIIFLFFWLLGLGLINLATCCCMCCTSTMPSF